jgi:hypothetical protein
VYERGRGVELAHEVEGPTPLEIHPAHPPGMKICTPHSRLPYKAITLESPSLDSTPFQAWDHNLITIYGRLTLDSTPFQAWDHNLITIYGRLTLESTPFQAWDHNLITIYGRLTLDSTPFQAWDHNLYKWNSALATVTLDLGRLAMNAQERDSREEGTSFDPPVHGPIPPIDGAVWEAIGDVENRCSDCMADLCMKDGVRNRSALYVCWTPTPPHCTVLYCTVLYCTGPDRSAMLMQLERGITLITC